MARIVQLGEGLFVEVETDIRRMELDVVPAVVSANMNKGSARASCAQRDNEFAFHRRRAHGAQIKLHVRFDMRLHSTIIRCASDGIKPAATLAASRARAARNRPVSDSNSEQRDNREG